MGFADILKRRLLRSVLTLRNVAVSKYLQDLATIDALRDIEYPSCAYYGTSFAYMHIRTRVPKPKFSTRVFYIRRGLRVVGSNFQGNARASKGGTDKSRTPRFFYMYIVLIRTKKLIT